MNATQNPAKPAYKRAPQRLFYIEVTDTFAGEANYSWVTRHIIRASTERGAVNKFSRLSGMEWRGAGCERYDSKSGATCFFLSAYTHDEHSQFLSYSTDERTDLEKLGAEISAWYMAHFRRGIKRREAPRTVPNWYYGIWSA
jgi:hypothetical protein